MEITDDNEGASASSGAETPHVLANLGEEIRRLRRSRGLRVTELAARIGRSVGFVSQIERGLSKPALKDLYAISVCLGVQVSWFLADPATAPARERGLIVRRGARRSYEQGGIATEVLSPQMGEELELMISTVQPGATFGKRKAAHTGREAGVVLKGKLEMSIDGESFVLEEGDSYSYLTTTPHHSRNIGDEPALLLWVVTHF